jgi:3-phosphoshikimate 1-carboxyvinyltransferase
MFAPLLALSSRKIHIQGSGSLLSRPMDFFDEILPVLEVRISSNKGKLPISIEGPLVPKNIEIDGSLSSQFLTGLLFAYSASGAENVSINVKNLKSAPYIDLTLKVLEEFGLALPENKNYQEFRFGKQNPDLKKTNPIQYTVEADWSGSAFLLVAGAIAGNIEVEGLDPQSTQADKKILKALHDAGADLKISNQSIRIQTSELEAFQFDATDCPDLFPPLVALASYCSGNSLIRGVTRLAHKESNRGLTLQEEFGKLGVKIELSDDLMIVHGGLGVDGGQVHSRHDHRIAMACAVAALKVKAGSEVRIEDAEAINKSYPDFYEHLKLLGAGIRDQQIKTLY